MKLLTRIHLGLARVLRALADRLDPPQPLVVPAQTWQVTTCGEGGHPVLILRTGQNACVAALLDGDARRMANALRAAERPRRSFSVN